MQSGSLINRNLAARYQSGTGSQRMLDEAAATLKSKYGPKLDNLSIERLIVGLFFVGARLSNGCGGVAYTPPEIARNAGNRILKDDTPVIRGMPVLRAMEGDIPGPFSEVIRLAVINALSLPFFESGDYRIDTNGDISGFTPLFRNRRVCMIGAIIPLLRRLKPLGAAEIKIIDRKEETEAEVEAEYGRFLPPEETARALADCETAIFTGATIANGTIEELISLVPADAAIAVVGPTAGFIPDPLFWRKVAMVGTVIVTDSSLAMDILAEGGGGYRLFGNCVKKINLFNTARMHELNLTI